MKVHWLFARIELKECLKGFDCRGQISCWRSQIFLLLVSGLRMKRNVRPARFRFALIEHVVGAGVFSHSQVVKDQPVVAVQAPHFLSDVELGLGFNQAHGETS